MAIVDPDVLQAQYFIAELERAADDLVNEVDRLQTLAGGYLETRRRIKELHDVRRLIEAIRRRFAVQI
ncbi:hypothetical protein ACXVUM_06840 [Williamsia sp. SKLECPSW1]